MEHSHLSAFGYQKRVQELEASLGLPTDATAEKL
jgi:hypothetical protein